MPGDLSVISVDVTESPPYLIGVSVANKSPRYANDAPLILCIFEDEELVYTDTALVSVSGDSVRFHEFGPWAPSQIREYLFTTEVIYPADEVPPNDTLSAFLVLTDVAEEYVKNEFRLDVSISEGMLSLDYAYPRDVAFLNIYDASGLLADRISLKNQSRLSELSGFIVSIPGSLLRAAFHACRSTGCKVR